MRRSQRLIVAAVAAALCSVLAGCGGGINNFDPTDMLDFLDTKKKLPGERKPVFPDGVPGLDQGVPKELYKGARQDQVDPQAVDAAAAAQPESPPAEPKSKRAAKGKGKNTAAAHAAPTADADAASSEEGAPAAVPPEPKHKKLARKRTTAPPAEQSDPSAQPAAPAQQSGFPAPLPSGSFTR